MVVEGDAGADDVDEGGALVGDRRLDDRHQLLLVARSFSGDKQQLVPIIKAAIAHKGAAFIDIISPCVAFNNHAGSTKSFDFVREHNEAVNRLDFMSSRMPIEVQYEPGTVEV